MSDQFLSPLLCTALASTIGSGSTVLTIDEYRRRSRRAEGDYRAVGIRELFALSHIYGGVGGASTTGDGACSNDGHSGVFYISVKTTTGKNITIGTRGTETVGDVKRKVHEKQGILPSKQRLTFNGKELEDSKELCHYNIGEDCTLYVTYVASSGRSPIYYIDDSLLDSKYDYDFTNMRDDGTKYYRGEKLYYRPYGWKRYGLKVLGKYDNGDNTWLGENGIRTISCSGEWPVSYHGTGINAGRSIAQEGYDVSKGKRFKYGRGIYSAPSIDVAAEYAQTLEFGGKKYQLVFQNRVSTADLKVIDTPQGELWVQPHDHLIRPYGICVRPVPVACASQPAGQPVTTVTHRVQARASSSSMTPSPLSNVVRPPAVQCITASTTVSNAQTQKKNTALPPGADSASSAQVTVNRKGSRSVDSSVQTVKTPSNTAKAVPPVHRSVVPVSSRRSERSSRTYTRCHTCCILL